MSSLYMKGTPETIGKYVIFYGDPWRVNVLKNYLDNPVEVAFSREFNTYTGTYKGQRITVSSTGMGAPTAAIAMEEMYECGMEVALRMGTVMSLQDDMLGHFIVPIGTPVYPMMRGTVIYCGKQQDNDNAGYVIVIRHQNNILCKYTSLATINVTKGQTVTADTMIARSGSNQTSLDSEPGLIIQIVQCDNPDVSEANLHGTSIVSHGTSIDYFDFVYNIWPASRLFESIVGS